MTYTSVRELFNWQVPDRFNMGVACSDVHPADATGLIAVDAAGAATEYTFGELSERSDRLAQGMRDRGINRGDRVAVVAPQSLETALTYLAVWKLGAVSLPLASLFGPDALAYRLSDSAASLAVASVANVDKLREAAPNLPVITIGPDFDELAAANRLASAVDTNANDPAFLIYTSGTTGSPKGALHAHRSLFGHLPGFECYYEFPPRDGDLIWTPADWAWIGGLMDVLVPAWYFGMPVLTAAHDFEPKWAVDLMVQHCVTLAFIPPTALKMMRAADVGHDDLALRAIFTGGEALGEEVLAWSTEALGCGINEGYGQTEANLVVGNCTPVWPVRPGSMGRALPGHDVAIFDDAGNRLVGETGEICVRSPDPVMMLEYWNQPDATAEKYRGEWLLTGDLGMEDEDGYLWFRSRKDDVIMSRGYRIGPGEIEESLMAHPAVAMSAVIGIPDDVRGEVPAAFVVLRADQRADAELAEELQTHVRNRLAAHEVPRQVTFVDELPRTTTGKIMRRALRNR
jgi:acetyl-CoA synthetase